LQTIIRDRGNEMADKSDFFFNAVMGTVFGGGGGGIASLLFGIPAYNRYQDVQNASNQVQINEIHIHQQEQLIQVVLAVAENPIK